MDSEQCDFAETIRKSGDALLSIINDILDFSKIEAGRMELESLPFDLRECVEGAVDLLASKADEKGLDLTCLIGDHVPQGIVGDGGRLRQILVNLLSNAIKFTEKGGIEISVYTLGEASVVSDPVDASFAGMTLCFSVSDSGIGIQQDRMDRLFQSFSQVDVSTSRRYGGTGLGLAISKRLVDLMGGRIWVESEAGVGSVFHFTIETQAAMLPKFDDFSRKRAYLSTMKVLVVDDNATNRRILSLYVQGWDMIPRVTEYPEEALRLILGGENFDVAILDMCMPEMDGMTLAREIHKLCNKNIPPVIMLGSTGHRDIAPDENIFEAYLTKPIKASQLFNALVKILSNETVQASDAGRLQFDAQMGERHPLSILLAEDNAINQKLALKMLARMGYRADIAANGIEVIAALHRQAYDVILVDIQMPEMDGLEASQVICKEWPEERRPRIVAMTANVTREDREVCLSASMNDFVGKPVKVEELVGALSRCVQKCKNSMEIMERIKKSEKSEPGFQSGNPEHTILDSAAISRLHDMAGGDQAFIIEMIDTFLSETPGLVNQMKEALACGDAETFRRMAHSLKSNSRDFGAAKLSEYFLDLEKMGKAGALGEAKEKISIAEEEYKRVVDALKTMRESN